MRLDNLEDLRKAVLNLYELSDNDLIDDLKMFDNHLQVSILNFLRDRNSTKKENLMSPLNKLLKNLNMSLEVQTKYVIKSLT